MKVFSRCPANDHRSTLRVAAVDRCQHLPPLDELKTLDFPNSAFQGTLHVDPGNGLTLAQNWMVDLAAILLDSPIWDSETPLHLTMKRPTSRMRYSKRYV